MEKAFEELRASVCRPGSRSVVSEDQRAELVSRTVVAMAVGGTSTRMKSKTDEAGVNKSVLRLPDGDTMLAKTIRMYRDSGFTNFLALVAHQAESIESYLGDGRAFGVNVSYSHDPGGPIGRGGAIRNALDIGAIPKDSFLVVHNPDDVIIKYRGSFPDDLLASHKMAMDLGMKATAVLTDGLPATYTGMVVDDGVVTEVAAYPRVPVPAHIGVTMFSPEAFQMFEALFDLRTRSDFEAVLFPELVKERTLFSMFVPSECWLQVNDPKAWDAMVKHHLGDS